MGIVKTIQKMFSKNIDCSKVLCDTPFHFYSQKNRVVYVGANIIVKEGFEAVFVCNDRVTDVLPEGKHSIIATNLPTTFKRLHLLSASKNGTFATKFRADIYFVSKNKIRNVHFKGGDPLIARSKHFGRIKAYAEGTCDVTIVDAKKLLTFLLLERQCVLDKDFLGLLGCEIGNKVVFKLSECGKGFLDILTLNEEVYNILNDNFVVPYLGCDIENVRLISMQVPEKLEEKLNKEIEKRRSVNSEINEIYGTTLNDAFSGIANKPVEGEPKVEEGAVKPEVERFKKCMSCGSVIDKNVKFCPNCGMRQNLF